MICLRVHATSGHYRVPGQVKQGSTGTSFPICPVSTMRGFLESLCGQKSGSFEGEFAYGWAERPEGVGDMLRKVHVWASGGLGSVGQTTRVIKVDTMFNLSYVVCVQGPWEERVRQALQGNVERFGVLYLGESFDIVTFIQEVPEPPPEVEWVVPGTTVLLPVVSGRGYGNLTVKYGLFNVETGAPHFHVMLPEAMPEPKRKKKKE